MTDPSWIGREVRDARRRRHLGGDRSCAICAEMRPAVLRRASRRVVEFHHLGGSANDPDLGVFLCLTHHALLTEQMRDSGIPLEHMHQRTDLERLEAVLRGLALFAALLAESLSRWADLLAARVRMLDRNHPGWRSDSGTGLE